MSYKYSDAQMLMAAQISYLGIGEGVSVGEYIDQMSQYGYYENGSWNLHEQYQNMENSSYLESQFQTISWIQEIAENTPALGDDWRNWVIRDVCDDNDVTGYYGCLIDTGNGDAIIGSRGSESYDMNQFAMDWGAADFGLLATTTTLQQGKAREYLERIYQEYGNLYDTFSLTGHSLGGNLAQDMVIHASEEMRAKIDHCISFDGPGFTEEYILENAENIRNTAELMEHLQWSLVGSLLFSLPGVDDRYIAVDDTDKDVLWEVTFRHSLSSVLLDENGNYVPGDPSYVVPITASLSKVVSLVIEAKFAGWKAVVLYKLVSVAIHEFKEHEQEIKEFLTSFYYDHIASSASGEFEIHTGAVIGYKQELEAAQRRLSEVNAEIEQIRRTWRNWTSSGAYYRSKLFSIKVGLESDIRLLRKMAEATEKIVDCYCTADTKSATLFI